MCMHGGESGSGSGSDYYTPRQSARDRYPARDSLYSKVEDRGYE